MNQDVFTNKFNDDDINSISRGNKMHTEKGSIKKSASICDTSSYILKAVFNSNLFNKINLSPTARAVLMAVINGHYRKKGYTSLNQNTLAETIGCRRETVCKSIKVLRDMDLIYTTNPNYISHIRYHLSDKFFNLIQQGAEGGDLQQPSNPVDKSLDRDELLQGCNDKSQHNLNNNKNYIQISGSNFSDSQYLQDSNDYSPKNSDSFYKGAEGGSATTSNPVSDSEKSSYKRVEPFDKDYKKNNPEKARKNLTEKVRKIMKSPAELEKYIQSSDFRKKYADSFRRFQRGDLENYMLNCNSPADCVNFLEKFKPDKQASLTLEQEIEHAIVNLPVEKIEMIFAAENPNTRRARDSMNYYGFCFNEAVIWSKKFYEEIRQNSTNRTS